MAAILTANGITFSDTTSASARSSFFAPSGTVCLFYRSTAPSGWTQVTTHNDKMLRIVTIGSAAGGGSGGTNTFSTTFATRPVSVTVPVTVTGLAVNPTTLDINSVPQHAHPVNLGGNVGYSGPSPAVGAGNAVTTPGSTTGNQGAGGAHTHPVAGTFTASGPWSSSVDMRLQYIDIIFCSFGG